MATRFLFDPPRRPKPKVGPNIKSLLVRCPSTSKLTDTGRTIEEKRWPTAKLKTQGLPVRTAAACTRGKRKTLFLDGPRERAGEPPRNSCELIFRIPID